MSISMTLLTTIEAAALLRPKKYFPKNRSPALVCVLTQSRNVRYLRT
jgi:hypothetical protein